MGEIAAINNTGSRAVVGRVVKADIRLRNSFTYMSASDNTPLGIIAQSTPHKSLSRITTSGIARVSVKGRFRRGDSIRLSKPSDTGIPKGQCVIAKPGDAPYLKVGTSQQTGTGLATVSLEWAWVSTDDQGAELLKTDQTTPQTTLGTLTFPQSKFGTSANYTEFEADGTLRSVGDATTFLDSMVPPTVYRTGGTSLTLAELVSGIYAHRFDTTDQIHFSIQFNHGIQVGTTIYPHVHLVNKDAIVGAADVTFSLSYSWANRATSFPAVATPANKVVSYADKAGLYHTTLDFDPIVPIAGQGNISSILIGALTRVNTGYTTNNIFLLGFDCHYATDTMGSRTEWTK